MLLKRVVPTQTHTHMHMHMQMQTQQSLAHELRVWHQASINETINKWIILYYTDNPTQITVRYN